MKRSKVITAVIAIIAVVAAACVYGYVRSKPADEPEKPAVTEPENPTTPETPDDSNSGKPSDSKTDEPAVQPENPNPSGTESVTIYVPDEQGETLTPTGADAKDDSDQSLVDALIAAGSLPEGVKVQSSSLENGTLTLDMNAAFARRSAPPAPPVKRSRSTHWSTRSRRRAAQPQCSSPWTARCSKADTRSTITRSSQTTDPQKKSSETPVSELFLTYSSFSGTFP